MNPWQTPVGLRASESDRGDDDGTKVRREFVHDGGDAVRLVGEGPEPAGMGVRKYGKIQVVQQNIGRRFSISLTDLSLSHKVRVVSFLSSKHIVMPVSHYLRAASPLNFQTSNVFPSTAPVESAKQLYCWRS